MGQIVEYIKMALDNIRANKGRSFLTMLGIIIGITSVVTIVSVGNGLKSDVVSAGDGTLNTVDIQPHGENLIGAAIITEDDIQALKISVGDLIDQVVISQSSQGKSTTRKGSFDSSLNFTTADYETAPQTSPIVKGSYFTENDVENANSVCVIDELTAMYLFGNTNVVGMSFELSVGDGIQDITITGIRETDEKSLESEKRNQEMDLPKHIFVELPYTLSAAFGDSIDAFSSVTLVVLDADNVDRVGEAAVKLLNSRHQNLGEKPFVTANSRDLSELLGQMMDGVTAFVAMVAGISLVVGGVGVMNIMLVSVTERTREIGIRKALGAKTGSIICQFLFESAIISGIGGIIGIILGAGATAIINALKMQVRASLSLPAILIATVFSCGVGIVFGIYPARKAARLSPIEALRSM